VKTSRAERRHFSDFTRRNYRRLLRMAKSQYRFRTYSTFRPGTRSVVWRHDLDFSTQAALKLALIEADEDVQATYFVLLHGNFYNPLDQANTSCLRQIQRLGHEIALHFDAAYYAVRNTRELTDRLGFEKRIIEDVCETRVSAFSFHNPTARVLSWDAPRYAGLINAYSKSFQRAVGYCSDSNGYWRHQRLEDVLNVRDDRGLQVLTHPAWWQDRPMSPRDRVWRCIDGRADSTRRTYSQALKHFGRPNIR
jgi:hypothetical protein